MKRANIHLSDMKIERYRKNLQKEYLHIYYAIVQFDPVIVSCNIKVGKNMKIKKEDGSIYYYYYKNEGENI